MGNRGGSVQPDLRSCAVSDRCTYPISKGRGLLRGNETSYFFQYTCLIFPMVTKLLERKYLTKLFGPNY